MTPEKGPTGGDDGDPRDCQKEPTGPCNPMVAGSWKGETAAVFGRVPLAERKRNFCAKGSGKAYPRWGGLEG